MRGKQSPSITSTRRSSAVYARAERGRAGIVAQPVVLARSSAALDRAVFPRGGSKYVRQPKVWEREFFFFTQHSSFFFFAPPFLFASACANSLPTLQQPSHLGGKRIRPVRHNLSNKRGKFEQRGCVYYYFF